jgi:hypothetical protein
MVELSFLFWTIWRGETLVAELLSASTVTSAVLHQSVPVCQCCLVCSLPTRGRFCSWWFTTNRRCDLDSQLRVLGPVAARGWNQHATARASSITHCNWELFTACKTCFTNTRLCILPAQCVYASRTAVVIKSDGHSKTALTECSRIFFCNPILFAICTSIFSKLCIKVYNGM